MIRVVVVVLIGLAAAWLALRAARGIGRANVDWRGVDWRGVALAAGFVALAFYLRHATEIGGLG